MQIEYGLCDGYIFVGYSQVDVLLIAVAKPITS